jgi:hypothetical protein
LRAPHSISEQGAKKNMRAAPLMLTAVRRAVWDPLLATVRSFLLEI